MKVIHIESGLGNQMLSYCELLAVKKVNPEEPCYLETILYEIGDAGKVISQWNGYELEKVFGISDPNVRELFTLPEWDAIHASIENSGFWEKNWNWPVYFCQAFAEQGVGLRNLRGDFEENRRRREATVHNSLRNNSFYQKFQKTWLYANLRRYGKNLFYEKKIDQDILFYKGREDALTGQRLLFEYKNSGIERIDPEIRKTFVFPAITDEKNRNFLDSVQGAQTVAIHVRRGDMLRLSGRYYQGGFFRRATKFLKHKISDPVFCFFCDPESTEWCKQNEKIFGLDYSGDKVMFIDWNKGGESFRDMQLMSLCRHNIITISSFGWWGSYLNNYKDKITISPETEVNTTHHF